MCRAMDKDDLLFSNFERIYSYSHFSKYPMRGFNTRLTIELRDWTFESCSEKFSGFPGPSIDFIMLWQSVHFAFFSRSFKEKLGRRFCLEKRAAILAIEVAGNIGDRIIKVRTFLGPNLHLLSDWLIARNLNVLIFTAVLVDTQTISSCTRSGNCQQRRSGFANPFFSNIFAI